MSLTEDEVDDIFKRNEKEDGRLRQILKYYMNNSGFKHTGEEIASFLTALGVEQSADKAVNPDGMSAFFMYFMKQCH